MIKNNRIIGILHRMQCKRKTNNCIHCLLWQYSKRR